jgi:hypothetical protein
MFNRATFGRPAAPAFGAPAPAPAPFGARAPAGPADVECGLPADADSVQSLSWSPTANFLAAGGWDAKVRNIP